ncbi:MAG: putative quinol monooxygenase [Pseudomonadales bacterium]
MLTIIARPTVDPEKLDEVKLAMFDLVKETLKEDGCIRYELHQDNSEPNKLTFIEIWQSHELWQKHMDGEAVSKFRERASGGIVAMELSELTQLAPDQTYP